MRRLRSDASSLRAASIAAENASRRFRDEDESGLAVRFHHVGVAVETTGRPAARYRVFWSG